MQLALIGFMSSTGMPGAAPFSQPASTHAKMIAPRALKTLKTLSLADANTMPDTVLVAVPSAGAVAWEVRETGEGVGRKEERERREAFLLTLGLIIARQADGHERICSSQSTSRQCGNVAGSAWQQRSRAAAHQGGDDTPAAAPGHSHPKLMMAPMMEIHLKTEGAANESSVRAGIDWWACSAGAPGRQEAAARSLAHSPCGVEVWHL